MRSKLRMYIDSIGYTAYRLEKDTGLSHSTINRLMRNDGIGSLDTWVRVAEAIGCTIDDILKYKEDADG